MLNLFTADWNSPYSSENLSNNLSIAIIALVMIVPPIIGLVFRIPVEEWRQRVFMKIYGTVVDGKKHDRQAVILFSIIFFLRKIVFAWSVIKLQDQLWLQITL